MWFPSTVYLHNMLPSSDLQTKIIQFLHVLFLSCKESFEKFKWIDIYTKHAGKSIPHSSNSERKDYFLKAQRYIHCYPASDAFSRMNYCQITVVTTYLCCCLIVRFNVKTMLIQPEETLVKFYYFQLQQPEFLAVNKIITPRHFLPLEIECWVPVEKNTRQCYFLLQWNSRNSCHGLLSLALQIISGEC